MWPKYPGPEKLEVILEQSVNTLTKRDNLSSAMISLPDEPYKMPFATFAYDVTSADHCQAAFGMDVSNIYSGVAGGCNISGVMRTVGEDGLMVPKVIQDFAMDTIQTPLSNYFWTLKLTDSNDVASYYGIYICHEGLGEFTGRAIVSLTRAYEYPDQVYGMAPLMLAQITARSYLLGGVQSDLIEHKGYGFNPVGETVRYLDGKHHSLPSHCFIQMLESFTSHYNSFIVLRPTVGGEGWGAVLLTQGRDNKQCSYVGGENAPLSFHTALINSASQVCKSLYLCNTKTSIEGYKPDVMFGIADEIACQIDGANDSFILDCYEHSDSTYHIGACVANAPRPVVIFGGPFMTAEATVIAMTSALYSYEKTFKFSFSGERLNTSPYEGAAKLSDLFATNLEADDGVPDVYKSVNQLWMAEDYSYRW